MRSKCAWLAGELAALMLFAAAVGTEKARASSVVSEVAGGVTLPQPLGIVGETLNRPAGMTAQGWFRFDFLPEHLELNLTLQYLPFSLVNVAGSSGARVDLGMITAFAGATIWGGPSIFGVRPLLMSGIGGVYDFMTFPAAPGFTSNAGTSFAIRVEPGLDVPMTGRLGLYVGLPMTVVFPKNTWTYWESSFSLRWKL